MKRAPGRRTPSRVARNNKGTLQMHLPSRFRRTLKSDPRCMYLQTHQISESVT
jgi:hypothetical protein